MPEGIAHIPSLRISHGAPLLLGKNQLCRIPFDEWYAMDQTFTWAESKYRRSDPVFFKFHIPFDISETESLKRYCLDRIGEFYHALVLAPGCYYFPHPQFSCFYVRKDNNGKAAYTRFVGPFNREWIVFGNVWNNPYDETMLGELQRLYSHLESPLLSAIENQYGGFALFEEISEPEFLLREIIPGSGATFDNANSFVRVIAWLENVLLNERQGAMRSLSITKVFGLCMAALLAKNYSDIETYAPYFSSLYRLRSKLVHGETHWTSLSANDQDNCRRGIVFAAMVYRKIISYHLSTGHDASISRRMNALLRPDDGSVVLPAEFDQFTMEINSML